MQNVWLNYGLVKNSFPKGRKVGVFWPGHNLDGTNGLVNDYILGFMNNSYYVEVEIAVWTHLYGMMFINVPWNRLRRVQ